MINGDMSCPLQLQVWQLKNLTKLSKVGAISCVQSSLDIRYYDIAFSGSQQGESFCGAGDLPGILTFSDAFNVCSGVGVAREAGREDTWPINEFMLQNIYTSVLCLSASTGVVGVNGGGGGGEGEGGVAVDVGSDTSVSLYTVNGQLMVYVVSRSSFLFPFADHILAWKCILMDFAGIVSQTTSSQFVCLLSHTL